MTMPKMSIRKARMKLRQQMSKLGLSPNHVVTQKVRGVSIAPRTINAPR
jgi:hypothetical protein